MRLEFLKIQNFRGYKNEVTIPFDDLTSFVGKNDIGKSTILEALEIFFNNETVTIDSSDVNVYSDEKMVRIACSFSDFPAELTVDESSITTFEDENLLNEKGHLEIVKTFDLSGSKPKISVFARALHPFGDGIGDLLQLKNAELKKRAQSLGIELSSVDTRSNAKIRKAIMMDALPYVPAMQEIPLTSESGKEIWTKIEAHMPAFALFQSDRASRDDDPEVQDPMRVAIQAAIKSVAPELERIKKSVEKEAVEVARRTLAKLSEMNPELASELKPVFKSEPKWDGFKLSLTGDNQIPINKRGSGVRRLVLLNFFRAEAERRRVQKDSSSLILAIEEPESAQHPNNQIMLVNALKDLSLQDKTQIIVTTHVPAIAGLLPEDSLRFVKKNDHGITTVVADGEQMLAEVAETLGVLPDRRVRLLVYVEGSNDVEFLEHASEVYEAQGVINLRTDTRVAFVVSGGGNLKHWVTKKYLARLGAAEIHIYDRDDETPPKYEQYVNEINARGDGSWGCLTKRRELENYISPEAIKREYEFEITYDAFSDVPLLVARAQHEKTSSKPWDEVSEEKKASKISKAKKRLNCNAVKTMSLAEFESADPDGEILSWLRRITEAVA